MISSAERIVKDFEGKISDADKTKLEEQRKALEEALKENKSADEIKKMSEDLQQTMFGISQAAYSQVQQEEQAQQNGAAGVDENNISSNSDDDVIDAEYTKE